MLGMRPRSQSASQPGKGSAERRVTIGSLGEHRVLRKKEGQYEAVCKQEGKYEACVKCRASPLHVHHLEAIGACVRQERGRSICCPGARRHPTIDPAQSIRRLSSNPSLPPNLTVVLPSLLDYFWLSSHLTLVLSSLLDWFSREK